MLKEKNPYGVTHLLCTSGGSLVDSIAKEINLSSEKVIQLLELGSIYLNHKRILTDCNLVLNDYLRVHTAPRRFPVNHDEIKSCAVYEDKDFIICNKPHGLPSIPTVDNAKENLLCKMSETTSKNLHVTSRLDIATSGLIVFAKNKEFQKLFNYQLASGKVEKIYSATVAGNYHLSDYLEHYMLPSEKAPKQLISSPREGTQLCQLRILSKKFNPATKCTDLKINLITGRTHQIRSQLSFVGFPIVGDKMYGSSVSLNTNHEEIKLVCQKISFQNSNIEKLTFQLENT